MKKSTDASRDNEEFDKDLLHFSSTDLFPPNHTLVINIAMRTGTLFYTEPGEGKPRIIRQQQFSPNGIRVLLPLLQSYPHYCPYNVLLASLFPLSLEASNQQLQEEWEMAIRPVRRAIGSIMASLRLFGLTVHSLRGAGYLLKPL